jgi:hypothetical protein
MSKFKKKNEKKDEKTDTWLEAVATSKEKTDDDIRAEAADKVSSAVPFLTKSSRRTTFHRRTSRMLSRGSINSWRG